MIEAFREELVLRITGLTERQLRRLERLEIVRPSVAPREPGWPPLYSFDDLIRIKLASQLLQHDWNSPQILELIDELQARGFADPLVTVGFVADELDEGERRYVQLSGRRGGRAWVVLPGSTEARSGHHLDQVADMFELNLRDLRTDLVGTIEQLTKREPGRVEKVRGVHGSSWVVAGTRVPTALIARLAKAGWSTARIRQSYPQLKPADVEAALRQEGVRAA